MASPTRRRFRSKTIDFGMSTTQKPLRLAQSASTQFLTSRRARPAVKRPEVDRAGNESPYKYFTPSLAALLCGYMFFNKSFGYIHIPGLPFYVGEAVLAIGLAEAARFHVPWRRIISLSPILKALSALMALCAIRFAFDFPQYRVMAIRDSAIWYYGAFAFVVYSAAIYDPRFVGRLLRWYRRAIPAFIVWLPISMALQEIDILRTVYVPDSTVSVTTFKVGDYAVQLFMVLSYLWLSVGRVHGKSSEGRSELVFSVVGLFGFVVLATQTRGGIVASFVGGLVALLYLPVGRRIRLGFPVGAALAVAVAIFALLGVSLPSDGPRDVTLGQIATNFTAIVDSQQGRDSGTIDWRKRLWRQTLHDLHQSNGWIVGLGYGPVLTERYDIELNSANPRVLRNVHNSHLTLMARSGYPGIILWIVLWAVWASFLTRRVRWLGGAGNPQGAFVVWLLAASISILVNALFDPTIEGPQVGIWLYTIVGLGAAATRFTAQGSVRSDVRCK